MKPCGDCKLGVIGGAICPKCNGTTFVEEVLLVNDIPMPEEIPVIPVEVVPVPEVPVEAAPEVVA